MFSIKHNCVTYQHKPYGTVRNNIYANNDNNNNNNDNIIQLSPLSEVDTCFCGLTNSGIDRGHIIFIKSTKTHIGRI